jgi:hypothetical protein
MPVVTVAATVTPMVSMMPVVTMSMAVMTVVLMVAPMRVVTRCVMIVMRYAYGARMIYRRRSVINRW